MAYLQTYTYIVLTARQAILCSLLALCLAYQSTFVRAAVMAVKVDAQEK